MIGRGRRLSAPLTLLLIAAAAVPGPSAAVPAAAAADVQLEELTLAGPPWRTANLFSFSWRSSPPLSITGPYTVDYLIRDSSSATVAPLTRVAIGGNELRSVQVPAPPGSSTVPRDRYTIEAWAEGSGAPHAFATMGFDDEPPGPARPMAPSGWVRAGATVAVAIEHPTPPLPVSGVRGYALVLDHGGSDEPCPGTTQCTEAETDLDGGIDDDLIQIGPLLEEANLVRVAAVSNSGVKSSQVESVALHVDGTAPRLSFVGLPDGWANGPVRVTANATDPRSGMSPSGPEGPFTAISVDGGAPTVVLGAQAAATVHGDGTHLLRAVARDALGNAVDGAEPTSPRAEIRIDETPPRAAFASTRDPAEPERIVASITDALSGPDDRGTIAVRPSGSSQRFEPLPTVARGGHLSALWDSDSYPPGNYEFRAKGYDAAGNDASTELRTDGARLVLPSPLKTPATTSFGFGGRRLIWHRCRRGTDGIRCHRRVIVAFDRRPPQRTVPFGHGVPVGGRLTTSSGTPLAGFEVQVAETFAIGSSPRGRTTTVVTGPDGTFLARLEPGPSRRVSVAFGGSHQLTHATGRELRLGVRARVRLRSSTALASIGGAPVEFSGQVDHQDAPIPSSGLAVELQFQVLGSPWSEFRTVQTDPFGHFSYPYSFSDDDSRGIRFGFRAVVPAQAGWPYESGASRPVAVTGR